MSDLTINEFNQLIKVNYEQGIVYISGVIKDLTGPYMNNLHGYIIGTLPASLKPEKRLVFMKYNDDVIRIDITDNGYIVLMSSEKRLINPVNLFGIQYSIRLGHQLELLNGWEWWNRAYRFPSFSKHGSIVYLSGIMKGGLPNRQFAQLPAFYSPPKKLIFQVINGYPNGQTAQIEILTNGECLIKDLAPLDNYSGLMGWYSLDGIYYDTSELPYMELPINDQKWTYSNQKPHVSLNGNCVHLSGELVCNKYLKSKQSHQHIIGELPEQLRPDQNLIYKSPNNEYGYVIDIGRDGIIKALGDIKHINLNGISFFNNSKKKIINQSGGDINSNLITMGSLSGFDKYQVDGSQNVQIIDLNNAINVEGQLIEWQVDVGRVGETYLQIYRPINVDTMTGNGNYRLVGEFRYSFTQLGLNKVTLDNDYQLSVKVGDYIGWRYPDLGTIKYRNSSGLVKWLFGNSPGVDQLLSFNVGEPRTYAYTVNIKPNLSSTLLKTGQSQEIGSSVQNPARSAQHILETYQNKGLPYPSNGTYWIRVYDYLDAVQVYCNFSYRRGYGYMLVASVNDKTNWLPMRGDLLPLDPSMSYGTYQSNGQMGNYYRSWSDLDLNSILDKDPIKCQELGYKYVPGGKFCGDPNQYRLKLDGGISEFMFATGNGQYWMVLPRSEIPGLVTKQVSQPITMIDSSKNFEGNCDVNQTAYILVRPGAPEDPWINVGNQHACGPDSMFWGMYNYGNHTGFKNKNGGVQLFIGGPTRKTIDQKESIFPYNPSFQQLSFKPPGSATYEDAVALCATRGQKVCSKDELAEANTAGYSSCAAGWTDTVVGPENKQWVGYPTNMDEWINLNITSSDLNRLGQKCGRPGLNQSALLSSYTGQSDIYCCDKFNFNLDFNQLDDKYLGAKLWIVNAEKVFNQTYGQDIPYPIDCLIYNEDGLGVAVSKKGQSYSLINSELGQAPSKLPNLRCQLPQIQPFGPNRLIVFQNDIDMFEIKRDVIWPANTGNISAITYGSQIRLKNVLNSGYLTTQQINYYNPGSGQKNQVMGTNNEDKTSLWLIKTARGLGTLDNQGYSNEKYLFGKPIKNGDIIRLESILSNRNLHSNSIYKGPSGRQLIYTNERGKFGDSNDHWRVELLDGSSWLSDSEFKLIHVNTNIVLFSDATTYKPNPNSDLRNLEVVGQIYRGPGDEWKLSYYEIGQPVNNKCNDIAMNITQINLRLKITKNENELDELNKQKQQLIDQYTNECWKLSMTDYMKKMDDEEKQISKINSELNSSQQQLNNLNQQIKQRLDQKSNLNQKYCGNNRDYQKLLNREHCKPVIGCVNDAKLGLNVPAQCQSILEEINMNHGLITQDIASSLKDILVNQDSITDYDIRNHKDFYKLMENSKITQCPISKKS